MSMTGIEKITGRIEADARAEAANIAAEANAKCAEIRAEYEKKAEDAYWETLRSGVKECEDRADRLGRLAGMEARKSTLNLKQTMVGEAFDLAVKKICEMPQGDYVTAMAKLAAKAASGREAVAFNASDRDRCGADIVAAANVLLAEQGKPGELTLSADTRPIRAGFVLQQGDVEINCAVETLSELSRGDLAGKVAAILFD